MLISLLNHKGGVSRTTSTFFLAHGFSRRGFPVAVIDTDPEVESSLTGWIDRIHANGKTVPFGHYKVPMISDADHFQQQFSATVQDIYAQLGKDAYILVDTPSCNHGGSNLVAQKSDFVIVPMLPSVVDYPSTGDTIFQLDNVPHAVLLTQVDHRSFMYRQARKDVNHYDRYVMPNNVGVNEKLRSMYGVTPGKNLFGYDTVVSDLLVVFDTIQESAAGRRAQAEFERKIGASLFKGLNDRVHEGAYARGCPISV